MPPEHPSRSFTLRFDHDPIREVAVQLGPLEDGAGPRDTPRHGLAMVDERVAQLHPQAVAALTERWLGTDSKPWLLPAGEATKSFAALPTHYAELEARKLDRSGLLMVIGGGTLCDLGAFLGATWARGVAVLLVPTTLLAQVDAALGGKCGVNFGAVKNRIGVIRQPERIVVDPAFLSTLPEEEWLSGLGELLKTALLSEDLDLQRLAGATPAGRDRLLASEAFLGLLGTALRAKAATVRLDEHERLGGRAALNLGHTVGHVLESAARTRGRPLAHGVAVARGLRAESVLWPCEASRAALEGGLRRLGLEAAAAPAGLAAADTELLAWLAADKKRAGDTLQLPVLTAPGRCELRPSRLEELLPLVRAAL